MERLVHHPRPSIIWHTPNLLSSPFTSYSLLRCSSESSQHIIYSNIHICSCFRQEEIESARDLDQLIEGHKRFLESISDKALMGGVEGSLLSQMMGLFNVILNFGVRFLFLVSFFFFLSLSFSLYFSTLDVLCTLISLYIYDNLLWLMICVVRYHK